MPDPNEMLGQIQMKCADVARSKTALGYDLNVMASLGMIVFGNADAMRDAIQAPDGQPWRSALFDETAKRLPLEEEIERLRTALRRVDSINDNPARFSVEINDVVMAALSDGQGGDGK